MVPNFEMKSNWATILKCSSAWLFTHLDSDSIGRISALRLMGARAETVKLLVVLVPGYRIQAVRLHIVLAPQLYALAAQNIRRHMHPQELQTVAFWKQKMKENLDTIRCKINKHQWNGPVNRFRNQWLQNIDGETSGMRIRTCTASKFCSRKKTRVKIMCTNTLQNWCRCMCTKTNRIERSERKAWRPLTALRLIFVHNSPGAC